MTAAILAKLAPYAIAALTLIGAAIGWRRSIRREVKARSALELAEAQAKALQRDKDDLERMANVPVLDAARSREWLLSRDPATK